MVTLEAIHGRCRPHGECLVWIGAVAKSGNVPKIGIGKHGDGRTTLSARRVVYDLTHKTPKSGPVTTICGDPRCLNPHHLRVTSRAAVSTKNAKRPDVQARKKAAMTDFNRSKGKLTIELAREIRASDAAMTATGKERAVLVRELAQRYGVGPSVIYRVLSNRAWIERDNPFASLMR